jgi:hypothetical protein
MPAYQLVRVQGTHEDVIIVSENILDVRRAMEQHIRSLAPGAVEIREIEKKDNGKKK